MKKDKLTSLFKNTVPIIFNHYDYYYFLNLSHNEYKTN